MRVSSPAMYSKTSACENLTVDCKNFILKLQYFQFFGNGISLVTDR
jgi:hypothetical protein